MLEPVTFRDLPPVAGWRHRDVRDGFESVALIAEPGGYRLHGHTAAVENSRQWSVRYSIALDDRWITRDADIASWSDDGEHELHVSSDGGRHWEVDGHRIGDLDGCVDIDLESSACTNTIPIHRLALEPGATMLVPAVYVRAESLRVERLEQFYTCIGESDSNGDTVYEYRAPRFDYVGRLVYDASRLVVDYPGLAARIP